METTQQIGVIMQQMRLTPDKEVKLVDTKTYMRSLQLNIRLLAMMQHFFSINLLEHIIHNVLPVSYGFKQSNYKDSQQPNRHTTPPTELCEQKSAQQTEKSPEKNIISHYQDLLLFKVAL